MRGTQVLENKRKQKFSALLAIIIFVVALPIISADHRALQLSGIYTDEQIVVQTNLVSFPVTVTEETRNQFLQCRGCASLDRHNLRPFGFDE
jgi:hypothetical protein